MENSKDVLDIVTVSCKLCKPVCIEGGKCVDYTQANIVVTYQSCNFSLDLSKCYQKLRGQTLHFWLSSAWFHIFFLVYILVAMNVLLLPVVLPVRLLLQKMHNYLTLLQSTCNWNNPGRCWNQAVLKTGIKPLTSKLSKAVGVKNGQLIKNQTGFVVNTQLSVLLDLWSSVLCRYWIIFSWPHSQQLVNPGAHPCSKMPRGGPWIFLH